MAYWKSPILTWMGCFPSATNTERNLEAVINLPRLKISVGTTYRLSCSIEMIAAAESSDFKFLLSTVCSTKKFNSISQSSSSLLVLALLLSLVFFQLSLYSIPEALCSEKPQT